MNAVYRLELLDCKNPEGGAWKEIFIVNIWVDKEWSESQKTVLLCYMVITGLLTEFVDIIGTIDRKRIDKNKHRMRTKCTLEHK